MVDLRTIVAENLEACRENGFHDVLKGTAMDIVHDMRAYAADCEGLTVEELLPHVLAWLTEQHAKGAL